MVFGLGLVRRELFQISPDRAGDLPLSGWFDAAFDISPDEIVNLLRWNERLVQGRFSKIKPTRARLSGDC